MHGTGVRYFYYYLLLPIIFVSIRFVAFLAPSQVLMIMGGCVHVD